jgi:hypothetical protein
MRPTYCSGIEAAATRSSRSCGNSNAPATPEGASTSTAARLTDGRREVSPTAPPENVVYLDRSRRGVASQARREVPPGAISTVLAALAPVSRASASALAAAAGVGERHTLACLRRLMERGYVSRSDAPLPSGQWPSYSLTERGRELAGRSGLSRRAGASGAPRSLRAPLPRALGLCGVAGVAAALAVAPGLWSWSAATAATLAACVAASLALSRCASGGRRGS